MKKDFMEAMNFRHACKVFDDTKKISDEDITYILEAGRKSPSSFGQEGWKFLVITNENLKGKIRPFCWDQKQITTCSHLVIILAAIEDNLTGSEDLFSQVSPQVTPQVTPQVELLLKVLEDSAQPLNREELQALLGLKDRKSFRERYLKPALDANLIEMTIPDKPNSRLQKYRLK